MASINRVTLMGNLTKDPEVRKLKAGMSVGDLRMAINEKRKNKAGEWMENTCYVDVVAWGKQAENCGKFLHKGSQIVVDGKLQYEQWEKDGQKHTKLTVRADSIQFVKDEDKREPASEPAMAGAAEGAEDYPF